MSESFDAFFAAYPRRKGANPKAPARTAYDRALKKGVQPEVLLKAVQRYAADPDTPVGTPFVPMAATWLNQSRWEAHALRESPPIGHKNGGGVLVLCDTPAWEAWKQHLGYTPPINREFGWYLPSENPPQ